ncbi:MAG: choice-of-anchor D domain-containing protein [Myxococcota bacterium]
MLCLQRWSLFGLLGLVACGDSGGTLGKTLPKIAVTPAALDFAVAPIGGERRLPLVIEDVGTAPLSISALEITGPFALSDASPASVLPGAKLELEVIYAPTDTRVSEGVLHIRSDADGAPQVDVSLRGQGGPSEVEVRPQVIDFGSAKIGWAMVSRVSVINHGAAALNSRVDAFDVSRPDQLSLGGVSPMPAQSPLTVPAGATSELSVGYLARARGPDRGSLLVETCGDRCGFRVTINGNTVASDLQVQPSALDFATLRPGDAKDEIVRLKNTGDVPLGVAALSLEGSGSFSLSSEKTPPFTLAPDEGVVVHLHYAPTALGPDRGALVVVPADMLEARVSVPLRGSASSPVLSSAPAKVDFGTIARGVAQRRAFTVTNTGEVPVAITQMSLVGAPSLTLAEVPPFPLRLDRGESATAYVSLDALSDGVFTATVSVETDDPLVGILIPVAAVVGQPSCSLSAAPAAIDFGTVTASASTSLSFTQTASAACQIDAAGLEGTGAFEATTPALPVILHFGESLVVQIRYRPVVEGYDRGHYALRTADVLRRRTAINLAGAFARPGTQLPPPPPPEDVQCVLSVNPLRVDFGGGAAVAGIVVTHSGNKACVLGAGVFRGSHVGFSEEPQSWPIQLNPGDSATIRIRFTPIGPNAYSGRYLIRTQEPTPVDYPVDLFAEISEFCIPGIPVAYGSCACPDGTWPVVSNRQVGGSGAFANDGTQSVYLQTCESDFRCPSNQVYVESAGAGSCRPPPPICDVGEVPVANAGPWSCQACPYIIQYGALYDFQRVCTTAPPTCSGTDIPTFRVETQRWECGPICDGGQYDPVIAEGAQLCVPC